MSIRRNSQPGSDGALENQKAYFSSSLERGLSLLAAFTANDPTLSLKELAQRLSLNKSTVHRYAATLEALGYLDQDPHTRRYRLGWRVIDLGLTALNGMELRRVALPELEALAERSGHTVNISILDGTDVVYLERVRAEHIIDLDLHVGARLPAYCTSMGKVLLAHLSPEALEQVLERAVLTGRGPNTIISKAGLLEELERVRRQGFAVNNEELAYGLRSVAAPIRRYDGHVVAALNMAVHATMISLDELQGHLAGQVVESAGRISRLLGFQPRPQIELVEDERWPIHHSSG